MYEHKEGEDERENGKDSRVGGSFSILVQIRTPARVIEAPTMIAEF
jgi:hypothetical protein